MDRNDPPIHDNRGISGHFGYAREIFALLERVCVENGAWRTGIGETSKCPDTVEES
jgi:hypothetical protein